MTERFVYGIVSLKDEVKISIMRTVEIGEVWNFTCSKSTCSGKSEIKVIKKSRFNVVEPIQDKSCS
jgi:hypothetical protein